MRREVDIHAQHNVQISTLTRVAAIPPGAEPAHPVPEGFHIRDQKRRFSFTVGSADIRFEGRSLRLKEPLWEHPGKRLAELLRDAVER